MLISLENRNALVCGSSKGIGRAIAWQMAEAGANITLVARDEEALQRLLRELPTPKGQTHHYLVADFNRPDELRDTVAQHLARIGTIHILVNNTGGPPAGKASEASPADFIAAYTQHLVCSQELLLQVLPGMKHAGYGRIINIISTSVKQPIDGLGVSNTTRGAMGSWSKTISRELAPSGITVNNILPGATNTDRLQAIIGNKTKAGRSQEEIEEEMRAEIPARRFGKPEEIAYAAVFLASEQAAYITGTNVVVDGGRTACL